MGIMLTPYSKWISTNRLLHLNKIILMSHVHYTNSSITPNARAVSMIPHDYVAYKPALMFFSLINTMYEYYFKVISTFLFAFYMFFTLYLILIHTIYIIYMYNLQTIEVTENKSWSVALADYIRHHDESLLKSSEKMMTSFSEDYLPCTSFEEFCDVARKIYIFYL